MMRCPECRTLVAPDQEQCPFCRSSLRATGPASQRPAFVPVARFGNAAEAGYFAHELLCLAEIESELISQDDFDALDGQWVTHYVLRVPEAFAQPAAETLQQLVNEAASDAHARGHDGAESATATAAVDSGVNWVPIILTLAAGSAVFFGVKHWQDVAGRPVRAEPVGQRRNDLWEMLATPAVPWSQPGSDDHGPRQLWIEPHRRRAELREDTDGDGIYDRIVRIPLERP